MKNEDLIANLTNDLKPVKPTASQQKILVICYISLSLCALLVFSYWYWLKHEFNLPTGRTFFEVLILLITFALGIRLAVDSANPHTYQKSRKQKKLMLILAWPAIVFGAFSLLYLKDPVESLVALKYNTWLCPTVIASVALPAFLISIFIVKKGYLLSYVSTFRLLTLTSIALGALTLAFICPWTDPLHTFLWHVVPSALALTALSLTYYLASRALKR